MKDYELAKIAITDHLAPNSKEILNIILHELLKKCITSYGKRDGFSILDGLQLLKKVFTKSRYF
jgi:hypothetical protein